MLDWPHSFANSVGRAMLGSESGSYSDAVGRAMQHIEHFTMLVSVCERAYSQVSVHVKL